MTITFRQISFNTTLSSQATLVITFGVGIAAGSMIAVAGEYNGGATGVTLTTDKGDHATDCGLGSISNLNVGVNSYCQAFLSPTAGATTITCTYKTANATLSDMYAWEITGLTNPIFDQVLSANSTSSVAISSGTSGTLRSASEAAISYGTASVSPSSNGTGWLIGQGTLTAGNLGDGFDGTLGGSGGEHQVLSSTAPIAGTFNMGGSSGTGQVWLATFASGSAPVIAPPAFTWFNI